MRATARRATLAALAALAGLAATPQHADAFWRCPCVGCYSCLIVCCPRPCPVIDRIWIGALTRLATAHEELLTGELDWRARLDETLKTIDHPAIGERAVTATAFDREAGRPRRTDPLASDDIPPDRLLEILASDTATGTGARGAMFELRQQTLAAADQGLNRLAIALANASEDRARAADALVAATDLRDVMRRLAELRAATTRLRRLANVTDGYAGRLMAGEQASTKDGHRTGETYQRTVGTAP